MTKYKIQIARPTLGIRLGLWQTEITNEQRVVRWRYVWLDEYPGEGAVGKEYRLDRQHTDYFEEVLVFSGQYLKWRSERIAQMKARADRMPITKQLRSENSKTQKRDERGWFVPMGRPKPGPVQRPRGPEFEKKVLRDSKGHFIRKNSNGNLTGTNLS